MSQGVKPKWNTTYFGAAWIKDGKNGGQYISAKVGDNKADVKMWISVNGQEPRQIEYFNIVPKQPKVNKETGEVETSEKAPQYSLSFSTKAE